MPDAKMGGESRVTFHVSLTKNLSLYGLPILLESWRIVNECNIHCISVAKYIPDLDRLHFRNLALVKMDGDNTVALHESLLSVEASKLPYIVVDHA